MRKAAQNNSGEVRRCRMLVVIDFASPSRRSWLFCSCRGIRSRMCLLIPRVWSDRSVAQKSRMRIPQAGQDSRLWDGSQPLRN